MTEFSPIIVAAILAAGLGGLTVPGLTEMLKRFLKKIFKTESPVIGYVSSFLVCLGATIFTLLTTGIFNVWSLIIYTIAVFLEANGIYKFSAKAARGE